MTSIHEIPVTTIDGRSTTLDEYRGKTLLIVNVASRCGLTPQYQGLETLYRRHKDAGLVILGFPCDQFRHQEPGDEAAIQQFCSLNYDVSFPLFAKIDVNGPAAHPLYQHLKKAVPGVLGTPGIKWNFTKFLVTPDGTVKKRFAPTTKPDALADEVAKALPG